ncbi:MAG: CHASE2 domain-containing protein [Patescibacteria group bacterium]
MFNKKKKKISDGKRPLLVGLILGLLCASALLFGLLETWSRRISDRLYLPYRPDSRIVMVAIDDASMARLGRWPWDRSVHASLINKLASFDPIAIGYDVNFPEVSNETSDTALAEAIRNAGNVVLPVELELVYDPVMGYYTVQRTLPSISKISSAAKKVGHTNTPQDIDGVVRRIPLVAYHDDDTPIKAFGVQIAELTGFKVDTSEGTDAAERMIVHYADKPKTAYPFVSAADIIDDNFDAALIRGAIVMVGATAADLHDEQRVPTSVNKPMSGIEVHANIVNTLLKKSYLLDFPKWLEAFWLIVIGVLFGFVIPRVKARWSIPFAIFIWILTIIGAFILFDQGWIADILWPTIAVLFAFAAVMLERRIAFERQKREIKHAFTHYLSSSVVESILEDPEQLQLGGIRKNMTVLFSDVRGFTTISEGLEPEALVNLMNTYLSRMTDIVFEHEGVLDKYIGDAVMAFWNAPLDQEDHAKRAVETALEMLDELERMNRDKIFGDLELKIGVGINSGEMVVGNMGSKERFDYTVIGDNVNLGSRMEGLTKQYHISMLISENTKNELGDDDYLMRQVDLVAVKGKKEPVKMYEIMKRKKEATFEDEEFLMMFNRALEAYFAKDFSNAAAICTELLALRSMDGPTQVLRERSLYFKDNPPADDWDGAWIMKTK